MIINTEWGAFGENGELDFVRTKWDMAVDEMSVNPGKQIFEKMISGMYMGELVRQVIVDLMKDDLIFFNCNREKLLERGSFYTRYASEIESDPVGDYTRARMALEELDIDPDDVTTEDFSSLRYICEVRTLAKTEIICPKNVRAKVAIHKYSAPRTIEKLKILGAFF
mgnify:CR=1 FL=1